MNTHKDSFPFRTKDELDKDIEQLFKDGKSQKEICKIKEISRGTLVRKLKYLHLSKKRDKKPKKEIENLQVLNKEKKQLKDIESLKKKVFNRLKVIEKEINCIKSSFIKTLKK